MSKQDAYFQKIEAEIEEQTARMQLLKANAKKMIAEGKIGAYEEAEKLEKKIKKAKKILINFKDSSKDAWQNLTNSIKDMFSK